MTTEATERVWAKILQAMSADETYPIALDESYPTGRSGNIPVYDGSHWWVFRNSVTIYLGAENCADPVKVDKLRQNVNSLFDHYPDTVAQLGKLGLHVKTLLKHRIETFEDVYAWALSPFNTSPMKKLSETRHIHDTRHLAYNDFVIEVKKGIFVIPAAPRGSGVKETLDFSVPGSKKRYGARHEFTQVAFNEQLPKKVKPPRYRGKTAEGEPLRPRGRPRKDGLVPGSKEARAADRKKERQREARRAARLKAKQEELPKASIHELHPDPPRPRRPLSRSTDRKKEATN